MVIGIAFRLEARRPVALWRASQALADMEAEEEIALVGPARCADKEPGGIGGEVVD
jgi:hypothetical protein